MIQETDWYDERATFRAVTGGAYNFPMSGNETITKGDGTLSGGQFPAIGTIPVAITKTGLISSNGTAVRGDDDVNFETSQVRPNDYLYDGSVVRRIKAVLSPKLLELWQEFPSDLVDAELRHCERQFFKKIRIKNTHGSADATLQEALFASGDEFENSGAPVAYDATDSELSITVHK